MSRRRRGRWNEAGETLLEILMSVLLLGVGGTAVLGLVQVNIGAGEVHHKQSVAGTILDNLAEYLQDETRAPYVTCPGADAAYQGYLATFATQLETAGSTVYEPEYSGAGGPRFDITATVAVGEPQPAGSDPSVRYSGDCAAGETAGLQQLTLTVTSRSTLASQRTVIVKRTP